MGRGEIRLRYLGRYLFFLSFFLSCIAYLPLSCVFSCFLFFAITSIRHALIVHAATSSYALTLYLLSLLFESSRISWILISFLLHVHVVLHSRKRRVSWHLAQAWLINTVRCMSWRGEFVTENTERENVNGSKDMKKGFQKS